MGKIKNLLERMTTEPMTDYPYFWLSWQRPYGNISQYCDQFGFRLNNQGPEKGEFVFKNWDDGTPAFEVTYSNLETGRLRVVPTNYLVQYNEVLREHRKKHGRLGADPRESKISLVEGGQNAL